MWSILVITCIIFQTAVAIFLLNGVRTGDSMDKFLRAMLVILLLHLSTKFLLLAVLKDQFLYAQIPTGFSLAYGPLLLVIARSILGKPMRPRAILFQFLPFFSLSLIYLTLVTAGATGRIPRSVISGYAAWYQWMMIPSLYGYPIYVRFLLRRNKTPEGRLAAQMANIFLIGISTGICLFTLHLTIINIPGFDPRLLPYICFSAIPVLILRYRLRKSEEKRVVVVERETPEQRAMDAVVDRRAAGVAAMEAAAADVSAADHAATDRRYEKSGMDAARMDEYEAALTAFMEKSRIFLDTELSLEGLASRMKMPKHHLTQLLNERVMKNFYTYINEYRIAEAVARLNDHAREVNILSLAFDCGFNSRSSFNNYFKKITGYTPSAYRKKQLEANGAVAPSVLIPGTSPSIS
ncbi:helix-turn-helix domain-containing protein [Puia dinghuensis]|uniref:HTH araC/xylS-type domain-containing protein n=1 Tax=Puia dinghuensis TaxID=1792502 RepID=A0A8J2UF61_9BACT|nr:helix-turn-helix domain-containing protein [Puia dinghuensis]GGB07232.1 hypothetical protein GCM10011511_33390 [Puia dinghuensis]